MDKSGHIRVKKRHTTKYHLAADAKSLKILDVYNDLGHEEKAFNTEHAKKRIGIEHINREIKIFRICTETYRNKGKRGLLRVKLIASLYYLRFIS